MTYLYSCRHSGDQYAITKFDEWMNVQSTYLCTITECNCPAGQRRVCRHREMLPRFIQRDHIGTNWFFDYDRGGWVQGPEQDTGEELTIATYIELPADSTSEQIAEQFSMLSGEARTTPAEPTEIITEIASKVIALPTNTIPFASLPPPRKSWRRF